MGRPGSRTRSGWTWLGLFWAVLLLVGGAAAAGLQLAGPPLRPTPANAGPSSPPPLQPHTPGALPGAPVRTGWNGRIPDPDPALQQASAAFSPATLPAIGPDNRLPMQFYARPADRNDPRPKVAIVLSGFGLAEADSRAAIALPGPVDLAVSAYARQIDPLLDAARAAGHELLGSIPMESQGFPLNDAGFASLLVNVPPAANSRNLERALAHTPGIVGMTGASDGLRGERFADSPAFAFVPAELARHGLLYIDPRPGAVLPPGVAGRTVDAVIDDPPARAEVEAKLSALERIARARGSALGLAGPIRATTTERLAAWLQDIESRGLVLVPASALAQPAAQPPAPSTTQTVTQ